jgi:sigma-B regulation protein RsbU (phosphoserine phosphatase)
MVQTTPITADQILHLLHREAIYLFLGAAFTTVGFIAAAFAILRRRFDALLINLALFAILYGSRLWLKSPLVPLLFPGSPILDAIRSGINYVVPIPAFFFFLAAGFLPRFGKSLAIGLTVIFGALLIGTLTFGNLYVFTLTNNIVIIACMLAVFIRSLQRQALSPDFRIIRIGLLIFVGFTLVDNIGDAFHHYPRVESFGFVVLLSCLGYVTARQTVAREAQLGEIQKELQVAKRIQLSILPESFPASLSFQVTARYLPMTSVAGDFYDFLLASDHHAGLLIADVSGHGVPAALIASMVKLAATSQRDHAADPAALLTEMNLALCGNTQQQFVTAAYVHLDAHAGELRYAAAAHPPMLLVRNGQVTAIEENGLMLAAFTFSTYTTATLSLQPGDRLLLYTDGIIEAANAHQEEFGQQRLQSLLQKTATQNQAETLNQILNQVQSWAATQEDDLTLLLCDYNPQ